MRRFLWLLATATTALLCLPAEAAQLQRWQFNNAQNRLEFSTDTQVEPQAQMLFNPTRVVVDLPGVKLSAPKQQQAGKGAIQQIRLGQFTRDTARLVVEVAPGWTLDPKQVRVKASSATDWALELPTPSRETNPRPVTAEPAPSAPIASAPIASAPVAQTTPPLNPSNANPLLDAAVLEVQSASGGLLVKTSGRVGSFKLERSRDRRSFQLNITAARLQGAIRLPAKAELDRLGIQSINAITLPDQAGAPATTRITLNVPTSAVDWQASRGSDSGIILSPTSPPVALGSAGSSGSSSSSGSVSQPGASSASAAGSQMITVILPPGPPPSTLPGSSPGSSSGSAPPVNLPPTKGRLLVVIDPGHGGPDPGAVGRGGLRETDVNLDIAKKLSQQLEAAGIQTMLTRTGEYDFDLQPRVDIAERANASVFVSIHANAISLDRPDVNGVETYYYSSGKQLADTIHRNIIRGTRSIDRGVRTARFYVLTQTSMPAVLLETGFVTGAQDAANLGNPTFRSQMATAIAQGIREYLGR